jgi:hypothetical protein
MDKANQASPLSTGGAGTIIEYRLAGNLFARLLCGKTMLGLSDITRVRLQGATAGHTLDDIVIFKGAANTPRLETQVKRTVSPVPSDKEFVSVIEQCLRGLNDHSADVSSGDVQFGLAAAEPVNQLKQLRELTELARAHIDYPSLRTTLVPNVTAKNVCDRYNKVKQTIVEALEPQNKTLDDDELNTLTHRLLKALRVWCIEVEADGRDTQNAINDLAKIVPQGVHANNVLTHLVAIAEEVGLRAGTVDAASLRVMLAQRGIALSADPQKRQDLATLQVNSERYLQGIRRTIGSSLHLPRTQAVSKIIEITTKDVLTLLSGPPGVGKTALMSEAMLELAKTEANTVIGLSLTGRTGQSLADIQAELGANLATTLPSASTAGHRILFIDGTEQALTDAGQLIKSLLATLTEKDAQSWHVIATARSDAAQIVAQILQPDNPPRPFAIDELNDDEVEAVVKKFSSLAPLQRHPRSARLLRRPYIVDLLVRANVTDSTKPLGEEDVLVSFWQQVIRRAEGANPGRGAADAREQVCLELAEATMVSNDPVKLKAADNEALAGLRSDNVLVLNHTYHQFAHDILQDYICAYRLLEQDADALINRIAGPRRFIRAVRLAAQRRLANATSKQETVATWHALQAQTAVLAARDGDRWNDVPYLALIHLADPAPVLKAIEAELVANEGKQLSHLLNITRRNATTSRPEEAGRDFEIDVLLAKPIIELLADIGTNLPLGPSFLAPELTRRWLLAVHRNGYKVVDVIADPTKLTTALASWHQKDYGEDSDAILSALGLLADFWPGQPADQIIDRLASNRPYELSVMVENPDVAPTLARLNPKLCLKIATAYYVEGEDKIDAQIGGIPISSPISRFDKEGVRDHDPKYSRKSILASPERGPFGALLAASPEHGLRLINAVVSAATEARIELESSWRDGRPDCTTIEVTLERAGKLKTYRGTGHVWVWYRHGGVGPYPAISSLLALREWAVAQAEQQPVAAVADRVLDSGNSLALVAVTLSLFITNLRDLTDELNVYLEQPAIWHLEQGRIQQNYSVFTHKLPEDDPLGWQFDRVIVSYVLSCTKTQRQALKSVGERLLETVRTELAVQLGTPPQQDHQEMLLARKWSGLLNYELYRLGEADAKGYRPVTIKYPDDLVKAMEKRSAGPQLELHATAIMHAAIKIRDGEESGGATKLWGDVTKTLEDLEQLGLKQEVHQPDDIMASVAASVVVDTSKGHTCTDGILQSSIKTLLRVANVVEPASTQEDGFSQHSMSWDFGADRSAATALPLALLSPVILKKAGVRLGTVEAALLKLAEGVSGESRRRLTRAISPVLDTPCTQNEHILHDMAIKVFEHLIRSAGVIERQGGYRNHPTYLKGILPQLLATDKYVLHLGMTTDVLPWLVRATKLKCSHGQEAKGLLDALIEHDLLAWPAHYAGRHYEGTQDWRDTLDAYVAQQTLNGDDALLARYMDTFAVTPEALSGVLYQLAAQAATKAYGQRLFELWPNILDRLLPAGRAALKDNKKRTFSRDTDELDKALLPMPPKGADWQPKPAFRALIRWAYAFPSHPQYIERLLTIIAAYGLILWPDMIPLVLKVAGSDYARIVRSSSTFMVVWARLVLEKTNATDVKRTGLIAFIDSLARYGDTDALELQRDLEA